MSSFSFPRLAALLCGLLFAASAAASEEAQLIQLLNAYRAEPQHCEGQGTAALPPLLIDRRLVVSATSGTELQDALAGSGYPLANARSVSLSGPRNAQAAMDMLKGSYCRIILAPHFVEVGVSQVDREWRIVLARPLVSGRQGDWQAEGQALLALINTARAQARQCGDTAYAAAPALSWSAALGGIAEAHSRDMANRNFFSHLGQDGRTPGDRAELAGYLATQLGENIAAGLDSPQKVLDGWLVSPGHCANLMNPQFSELGAAYAVDPRSDAGIYWTALFGTP
jgi:uncharacterized protein YkwD